MPVYLNTKTEVSYADLEKIIELTDNNIIKYENGKLSAAEHFDSRALYWNKSDENKKIRAGFYELISNQVGINLPKFKGIFKNLGYIDSSNTPVTAFEIKQIIATAKNLRADKEC